MLDAGDGARVDFAAWHDACPEHAAAYARVCAARDGATALAGETPLLALRHETLARTMRARRTSRGRMRAAVAASVLLLAGAPLAAYGVHVWSAPAPVAPAPETFRTGIGQQADVTLPDGSTVTLDTDSRLEVRFGDGERRVILHGQGWFALKPSSKPFRISAGGHDFTTDAGTFDVRTDPGRVRAFAAEGRLALAGGASSVALTAGRLLAATGSDVLIRTPDDVAPFTGWRSGMLQFDDVPLGEAVGELNRYRTRPMRIADARAAALRVSGSFRAAESPAFADALAARFPVRVRSDGESLTIASR